MRQTTRGATAAIAAGAIAAALGARGAAGESWCDTRPRTAYAGLARVPTVDPWFHVYRFEPGVYALYEPDNFQEVISYLILGRERALLFDTGMGMSRIRATVEELTKLPVQVLNSHTHHDHVGGNAEFEAVLGMDTPFTQESAKGMAHEVVRGEALAESFCPTRLPGFDPAGYRIRPFRVSRVVRDGDAIELGGRRLEVLAMPGHTPDSVALLDRQAGLVFTGDTFYEGPIWLHAPGTDLAAYGRSVARLAALAPALKRVHPGHNTPTASPRRLVELRDAFAAVEDRRVAPEAREGGLVEYVFEGFSFLMRGVVSARP
ncbi:MAG TPA: MBL fold metallo-hydrolase [Vicinamibacteria bacterium]|nr:MBL fold metallo-hydrolase [Vicinamibacteria bacterium]